MADVPDAAVIAVLTEMDWPDDREFSAHVEPDGYQLTPPGAYWDMASDVARAAINAAAEDIARAIEALVVDLTWNDGYTTAVREAAAIARRHAVRIPGEAVEARNTPDAYPTKGPTVLDASRPILTAHRDDRQEQ